MSTYLLLLPALISFLVTLFLLPKWIVKATDLGLTWDDVHKKSDKLVAGSGGIIVFLGFIIGSLLYIAYRVFYLPAPGDFIAEILALLTSITLLAQVGFIDDLFGWQKGGLSAKTRIVLVGIASIPLLAINVGKSTIGLPIIGTVELGILYPLIAIPIGIIGATTTFNFLAGFNGLEAGQGILLIGALGIVAGLTGTPWLSVIALCMIASLLAFLVFNYSPAKTFPGDALTYAAGGLIAIISIIGNFERIAIFFFIPYIIETVLKVRGRLSKHSFGKLQPDGTLTLRYEKLYSLTHVSILLMEKMNIKPTEKKVVISIWLFQLVIIIAGFLLFRNAIF